jgi:hypothetical protein
MLRFERRISSWYVYIVAVLRLGNPLIEIAPERTLELRDVVAPRRPIAHARHYRVDLKRLEKAGKAVG